MLRSGAVSTDEKRRGRRDEAQCRSSASSVRRSALDELLYPALQLVCDWDPGEKQDDRFPSLVHKVP